LADHRRAGVIAIDQRLAAILAQRRAEHAGHVLRRPALGRAVVARQGTERPALPDLVLDREPAAPQLVAEQCLRRAVRPELRHYGPVRSAVRPRFVTGTAVVTRADPAALPLPPLAAAAVHHHGKTHTAVAAGRVEIDRIGIVALEVA